MAPRTSQNTPVGLVMHQPQQHARLGGGLVHPLPSWLPGPLGIPQGVKAEDVNQGAVGDCWLVAAMATLAGAMPGSIRKLFLNHERSMR